MFQYLKIMFHFRLTPTYLGLCRHQITLTLIQRKMTPHWKHHGLTFRYVSLLCARDKLDMASLVLTKLIVKLDIFVKLFDR